MFGSGIIDAVIGTIFIFIFVSLVATSAIEGIEGILKTRAKDLEKGIRNVLNDPSGSDFTQAIYEHPLISALFVGEYKPPKASANAAPQELANKSMPLGSRRHLPSYIPGLSFAGALVDVVFEKGPQGQGTALDVTTLKAAADKIPDAKLKQAVLTAIESAGGDIEAVKRNLATWFDTAMDRVTGWYKRRTQVILFLMGLFAAIVLNVDAITTFTSLHRNPALSAAIVEQAKKGKQLPDFNVKKIQDDLIAVSFPMGWKDGVPGPQFAACVYDPKKGHDCGGYTAAILFRTAVGWLITALAVMLGAPFWFDMLAKFMSIRATGKPIDDGAKNPKAAGAGGAGASGGGGGSGGTGSGSAAAPQSS
jgi:hypothetical protein